jgi:alkylation response protein AidB-like acyl-CoA dehydrogenase
LTPSPFLASAVLATSALMRASNATAADAVLSALAAGDAIGTVALASPDGSYDRARSQVSLRSHGESTRLIGTAGFVLDADVASHIVVAAAGTHGGTTALVVPSTLQGIQVTRAATVDETRRLFSVTFDDVPVDTGSQLCAPGAPSDRLVSDVLSIGAIAAAIDATGVAERAMEETARYASERMQFGKPIGSFQAVKHHCANMAVSVEASRAATGAAAAALDDDPSQWALAASIAASYVGPACSEVCSLSMRVHGGIGFTWEHDTHLFLKRVKLDEMLFGSPSWHRRRLADEVFPRVTAERALKEGSR